MISEQRAQEIDSYFYRDHRTRGKHFFITTGVGTVSIILCHVVFPLSESVSLVVAATSIVVTFLLLLAGYHPQTQGSSIKVQSAPWPTVRDFGSLFRLATDRRRLLGRMAFLAFAGIVLAILPTNSEAEVVNARIRRLLKDGKESEAEKAARAAIYVGIPLDPDVVRAAPSKPYSASSVSARVGSATVQIDPVEQLTINLPILYFTPGRWPTNGSLSSNEDPVSLVGAGPDKAFLVASSAISKESSVIIHSAHRINTLIFGLTVLPENGFRVGVPYFLTVKPGSSWVAVVNVVVQSLHQSIDRTIWQDTKFVDCSIYFGGDRFLLIRVTFASCSFNFAAGFPLDVRTRIENSQGQPLSINFSPPGQVRS